MEQLENQIKDLSIKYTLETNKDYLKKYGQFFTLSQEILCKLLNHSVKNGTENNYIDILEPSVGTGNLILECMKHFKYFSLDAIEIDTKIYDKTKILFETQNNKNINIVNNDFLKYDFEKKYDFIIGNPPYFEISKETRILPEITKNFKQILNGRTNIYSLFIYKSIKLLKKNGQLIFIIPKTILSGKYFSKLRVFIHQHCNIIDIIKFDNSKLFKNALQSVIILKLELRDQIESNNKFIVKINNEIYFVKNCNNLYLNTQTTSISKLNCIVKTGNVVWNKHKELLLDIKTDVTLQLIKSSNIKNGKLILSNQTNNYKKQYMIINDANKHLIINGPYILINRIVGLNPPKLHIYFEKKSTSQSKCFVENHVNFIKGSIENLTKIYNSLNDPKTIEFIKELIGNTQLSQNELENIIPIF